MHFIRSVVSLLRQSQCKVVAHQRIFNVPKISNKQQQTQRFFSLDAEDDTEKIVQELCNEDAEQQKKLRILMLEVEVMRQDGRCAPTVMQTRHWKQLLEMGSRSQRANYLLYLFKTEKSKENEKTRKEEKRKLFEEKREQQKLDPEKEYPDDLLYGMSHNSLFLRIRDQSINNFDNYRALQALSFGQQVVIDCSYEEHMVHREIINSSKQLTFVFGDNRIHKEPFNIHLCNVNAQGDFMDQLRRNIPSVDEPWFPLNIHSKSYLDVFPKNKLVYLTPHCRTELTEFDHDAIYIVGCMVDKINNEPLSLAKAKRDGIQMAKLPLDRYLEWAPGSKKNLNINHMIPILLDLKMTGDWEYALRHVPRRKLMQTKIFAMQNKLKNTNLKRDVLKSFQNIPYFDKNLLKVKKNKAKRSIYVEDETL